MFEKLLMLLRVKLKYNEQRTVHLGKSCQSLEIHEAEERCFIHKILRERENRENSNQVFKEQLRSEKKKFILVSSPVPLKS